MAIEFDTEKGDDLDTIRQRLTDAMAWFEFASRTAEPGFPRSPRLVPSALEHNRKRVVASVAYKRKAAIEGAGGTEAGSIDGRILGYLPDEQLADGAAELVTDGFFNVEDEPPWDLWLGWMVEKGGRDEHLVCWVPPTMVETADRGIEVNPMDCIHWLEELEQLLGLRP